MKVGVAGTVRLTPSLVYRKMSLLIFLSFFFPTERKSWFRNVEGSARVTDNPHSGRGLVVCLPGNKYSFSCQLNKIIHFCRPLLGRTDSNKNYRLFNF